MIRVEEVHNSLLFAAVLAIPGLVMLAAALMAWSGFHYVFSEAGLEVSTLGYRLRSIPPEAIREYYAAPWGVVGGYGIRGLGASRAYVWGKQGVRIKLVEGEIFLGSSDPQDLIRNLDQLTHRAHS